MGSLVTSQGRLSWCGEEDIGVSLPELEPELLEDLLLEDLHHTPIHGQGRGSSSTSAIIQRKVHSHSWHSWPLQCLGCLPTLFCFGALRSLPLSTHLVQGLLSLVLGVAGGDAHTRAAWGCAHGATSGAAPHPGAIRVTGPAAPPAGLQLTALARDLHSHLQARLCPFRFPLISKCAPKQSPDPGWARGCWTGGVHATLALRMNRARVLRGFHQCSRGKKSCFMQLLIHPPWLCSGPCLCIPT